MRRLLACGLIGCALALTVGAGWIHGRLLQRWGPDESQRVSARRLGEFPDQFGAWTLVKRQQLAPEAAEMLQCSGYLMRTYRNRETAETVTVAVLQGPTGPISVHTPEICYSSRNYRVVESRSESEIQDGNQPHSRLWTLTFESKDVDQSLLKVWYGWTADGRWQAPGSSRWAFAGRPYLYKIQLASAPRNPAAEDPGEDFLKAFLPLLRHEVFTRDAS